MTVLSKVITAQIEQGIAVLKRGGVIAFPTDTVYGLGVGTDIYKAVERVYRLKERPREMALPLLLADISQIDQVAAYVPPLARLLAARFLPGALTMVLLKAGSVPDIVTGGEDTVAVRLPDHPVPLGLARGLGTPIIGTSANLSGRPSALTAGEIRIQFGDKIDLVIDGGICLGGKESTVVDLSREMPQVLREGAISTQELRQVCRTL